jgi:hypothetical protein
MNQCTKCDKCFSRKSVLQRHNNNNACIFTDKIKCDFCDKMYTSRESMLRHVKQNCKGKEDEMNEKEIYNIIANMQSKLDKFDKMQAKFDKIAEMEALITRLTKENEKLKSTKNGKPIMKGNITNVNGNVTNVKGNMKIVNNIMLVGYGKEDISKISKNNIVDGVKDGFYSTLSLTDAIHFNPEYPEYHNVYISSMKNQYAMMYDGTNWTLVMKDYLINKLYTDKRNYIEENLDDFLDSLTRSQKNALDRWMDTDESHDKIKEIKNKIKLLLYNKRDIAMNNSGQDHQLEGGCDHTIDISNNFDPNNKKQNYVKVDKFNTMKEKVAPKMGTKRKNVVKANKN